MQLSVLVTSGRHDEMTPNLVASMVEKISDCQWALFKHSSHTASVEEPEHYRSVLATFLDANDHNRQ